jgi:uncharacterized protein YlaI
MSNNVLEDHVSCENCGDYYHIDDMDVYSDILDHSADKIRMYFCPICVEESHA